MTLLTPASMLARAISIVAVAFDGDFDKGGTPYVLHCLHVMDKVGKKSDGDAELMAIAAMHDLFEDKSSWNAERLVSEGFSDRVIDGVSTMTHEPSESYDDYITRITKNKDTVMVKMADIKHNSDPTRMKGLRVKDLDRIVTYHKAYAILKDSL